MVNGKWLGIFLVFLRKKITHSQVHGYAIPTAPWLVVTNEIVYFPIRNGGGHGYLKFTVHGNGRHIYTKEVNVVTAHSAICQAFFYGYSLNCTVPF